MIVISVMRCLKKLQLMLCGSDWGEVFENSLVCWCRKNIVSVNTKSYSLAALLVGQSWSMRMSNTCQVSVMQWKRVQGSAVHGTGQSDMQLIKHPPPPFC